MLDGCEVGVGRAGFTRALILFTPHIAHVQKHVPTADTFCVRD